MTSSEARARRLLRCYPRVWRDRYGEEFVWLLSDEIDERPRCVRRDIDVVRAGLAARLSACGLADGPLRDERRARTTVALAGATFAAAAASIWTQLARGALASGTASRALTLGLGVLTLCGLAAAFALLIGGVSLASACYRRARSGRGRGLRRPAVTVVASAATLVIGTIYMASSARGPSIASGSGPFAEATRATWALTDSINTFWLHPTRLLALPSYELTWMLVSPIAAIGLVHGLLTMARLVEWTASGYCKRVGTIVLLPMFVAAGTWVIGSQYVDNTSYHAGNLDLALVLTMLLGGAVVTGAQESSPRIRAQRGR